MCDFLEFNSEDYNPNDYDVIAFTDGGCMIGERVGGWGIHLIAKGVTQEFYGAERCSNANRMELLAAAVALEKVPANTKLAIVSDSLYVVTGITNWTATWRRTIYRSRIIPKRNPDIWERIQKLTKYRRVSCFWVKSHSGNLWNTRADILATRGMEELLHDKV